MKRLLLAVLLALPAGATSVTYSVNNGNLYFSLVAADFLPKIHPGQTEFRFIESELTSLNCGAMPNLLYCDGVTLKQEPDFVVASMRAYTSSYNFTALEAFFFGADLGSVGTWVASTGHSVMSISQDDLPVSYAPEPSVLIMCAIGIGLIGVKYARRLRHRAVDPEVVVSVGH
jgi:hypothetical protein